MIDNPDGLETGVLTDTNIRNLINLIRYANAKPARVVKQRALIERKALPQPK